MKKIYTGGVVTTIPPKENFSSNFSSTLASIYCDKTWTLEVCGEDNQEYIKASSCDTSAINCDITIPTTIPPSTSTSTTTTLTPRVTTGDIYIRSNSTVDVFGNSLIPRDHWVDVKIDGEPIDPNGFWQGAIRFDVVRDSTKVLSQVEIILSEINQGHIYISPVNLINWPNPELATNYFILGKHQPACFGTFVIIINYTPVGSSVSQSYISDTFKIDASSLFSDWSYLNSTIENRNLQC